MAAREKSAISAATIIIIIYYCKNVYVCILQRPTLGKSASTLGKSASFGMLGMKDLCEERDGVSRQPSPSSLCNGGTLE